ncbi:unnamed protein product [Vicia faba]|uniref:Cobalamin-independent methionine synthase MetE C-terminal/archaeal domain-containing protein n=1 Tax=Vicia faba TaxID=3906 RepID=A0AAV0ZA15_VICFA|nr:unnamed protein product [Vicia faba]
MKKRPLQPRSRIVGSGKFPGGAAPVDRLSGWKVCDNTTFAEAFQHQFVMVQQVRHIYNQTILISCETTESIIRMEFESYGVQSNGNIWRNQCDMDANVITIENSISDEKLLSVFCEEVIYRVGIGPGVYSIHSPRIPPTEEICLSNFLSRERADIRSRVKGRFVKDVKVYDYDPLSQTRRY